MVNQIAGEPDIAEVVRAVFDDLDMRQLVILRRLSGSRHLKEAFDLCEFARSLVVASIRSQHPHISDEELRRLVRQRISGDYELWGFGPTATSPDQ